MPRSVRTDRPQPTRHQGFARYASDSAHPELWPRGEAWAPGLGPTGAVVRGVVNGANGDFMNMEPGSDWQVQDGRYVLNFDDEDPAEHVRINDSRTANLEVTSVTMAIWCYLRAFHGTGNAEAALFQKMISDTVNSEYLMLFDNKKLTGRAKNSGGLVDATDSNDFAIDVWTHVAYTYDEVSGDAFLYIDGAEVASGTSAGGPIDTGTGHADIGQLAGSNRFHWDGFIDDVFIYDRPLSVSEIFKLYSLKRGGIFQRRPITVAKAVAAPPAGGPPKGSLALLGVGV